jgi:hypothetical protein
MLLIKEEEEACDEVDPLVLPETTRRSHCRLSWEKMILINLLPQSQNQIGIFEALVEDFLRC